MANLSMKGYKSFDDVRREAGVPRDFLIHAIENDEDLPYFTMIDDTYFVKDGNFYFAVARIKQCYFRYCNN